MTAPRRSLSLVTAGCLFVVASVIYAAAAAAISLTFLNDIKSDARTMQDHQMPAILAQNRNAVKVEKLASLVRSAYLARDARLERQILLQTQGLAQSFTLDGDNFLAQGAAEIADDVARIVAARAAERTAKASAEPAGSGGGAGPDAPARRNQAAIGYENAIHIAERLSAHLISDAALVADNISVGIEQTARSIQRAWMIILAVPVVGAVVLFWTFQIHVVRPINAAIDRLAAIGSPQFHKSAPPTPRGAADDRARRRDLWGGLRGTA